MSHEPEYRVQAKTSLKFDAWFTVAYGTKHRLATLLEPELHRPDPRIKVWRVQRVNPDRTSTGEELVRFDLQTCLDWMKPIETKFADKQCGSDPTEP